MPDSKSIPNQVWGVPNHIYNMSGFVTSAGRNPDVFLVKLSDWRYNREVPFFVDEGAELTIANFATLVNNWADMHPNKNHTLTWNKFCFELINSTLKSSGPAMPEKIEPPAESATGAQAGVYSYNDDGDSVDTDDDHGHSVIPVADTIAATAPAALDELAAFQPNPPANATIATSVTPTADFGALKLTPRS